MSFIAITTPQNFNQAVTVDVQLPAFNNAAAPVINFNLWLITQHDRISLGHGTNVGSSNYRFTLQQSAATLKGDMIRIDYTVISGKKVPVSMHCNVGDTTISDVLEQTIGLSAILFQ